MESKQYRVSLVLMSTLMLSWACGDDGVNAGGEGSGIGETGNAAEGNGGTEGNDGAEGMEGMEDGAGDGDGDSADGAGNSGDGDGNSGSGDGDSGDGDSGDGDSGDGDSGDGDSGDGDSGDGDSGDGDAGFCGDGVVDVGEECDGGVDIGPGSDCLADCTFNVCGDGLLGPQEGCDDGNNNSHDGCAADCTLENIGPGVIPCGNKIFQCGDTLDNDMDGLVDLDDPECTSPCDDDEGTFKTKLPGQNNDCKGDCYFDANSGGGDDQCEWNLKCDPENPGAQIGCEYDPSFAMCELQPELPQTCLDFCVPLLPNGCDCFGCCEIEGQFVYLDGAECSLDTLDECESCTFFESCSNSCDADNCELCFAENPQDLPPECVEPRCPIGITSCLSESDCAVGQFCQTGCCAAIVPG